jgi:hypothetical protein
VIDAARPAVASGSDAPVPQTSPSSPVPQASPAPLAPSPALVYLDLVTRLHEEFIARQVEIHGQFLRLRRLAAEALAQTRCGAGSGGCGSAGAVLLPVCAVRGRRVIGLEAADRPVVSSVVSSVVA